MQTHSITDIPTALKQMSTLIYVAYLAWLAHAATPGAAEQGRSVLTSVDPTEYYVHTPEIDLAVTQAQTQQTKFDETVGESELEVVIAIKQIQENDAELIRMIEAQSVHLDVINKTIYPVEEYRYDRPIVNEFGCCVVLMVLMICLDGCRSIYLNGRRPAPPSYYRHRCRAQPS
jgi:hypothetical protein